jgi:hypothetical protein
MGDYYFGQFFCKLQQQPTFCATFFPKHRLCIIIDKTGLGYNLADFRFYIYSYNDVLSNYVSSNNVLSNNILSNDILSNDVLIKDVLSNNISSNNVLSNNVWS